MAKNPFLEKLTQQSARESRYGEVMTVLSEFCSAIEQFTESRLACQALPGHVTNLGQEYRVMLVPRKGPARDYLLLRAHVPAAGYPVQLDFYDDDLISCDGKDALNARLSEFLERETTRDVIEALDRSAAS